MGVATTMKPLNFTQKLTFGGAFLIPFRIAPVITLLKLALSLLDLAATPLRVLATTYFIDSALRVYTEGLASRELIPALAAVAATYLYGYITEPVGKLLNKKLDIAGWLAIQHPMLDSYAGLKLECTEDSDTMDLITRVWSESPDDALLSVYSCLLYTSDAADEL